MEYEEVLKHLAPCGLSCQKCFAFKDGDIRKAASTLKDKLGNFEIYAQRFSSLVDPVFAHYPAFKELLFFLAGGSCQGCRDQVCGLWPECFVASCYREKKVDYCFQCEEFPCQKVNFDEHLKRRWVQMNLSMREIGVMKYYEYTRTEPRYK
jgi:hypothetical protein